MKKMSEQNRNVLANMIGAFAVKGGSLVISVILLPMYLGFFKDQAILGVWYTLLSVLNWTVLFDLGLGQGLRNHLPKALAANDLRLAKQYISTTYLLMTCLAALAGVLGWLLLRRLDLHAVFNIDPAVIGHSVLRRSVGIVFAGIMLQLILKISASILYAIQKSAAVNALALFTNASILAALCVCPSKDASGNLLRMAWIHVTAANLPYLVCTIVLFTAGRLRGAAPCLKAFSPPYIRESFQTGLSLMWLQIVFMVVSSANEFLISALTSPQCVFEYQAYHKVFKTAAMVVSLALTPIWSAVTKAQIERDYQWIKRIYLLFLGIAALCFAGELCLIPALQWGMDRWLGEGTIDVNLSYALIFALSSWVFVLHSINTSIGNGLSRFKLQLLWMTFAALLFIPLAFLFVRWCGGWIGVVLAGFTAMLPYEILAPIFTIRHLNQLIFPAQGKRKRSS